MVDRDREAAALERELGVWQEQRQRQMCALWEQRKKRGHAAGAATISSPEAGHCAVTNQNPEHPGGGEVAQE